MTYGSVASAGWDFLLIERPCFRALAVAWRSSIPICIASIAARSEKASYFCQRLPVAFPSLRIPMEGQPPSSIAMFRRINNLIRGFLSMFISGLERKNPEALLETEKENLRRQIAKYNTGLAAHAGLCEKLIGQVRRLEKEHDELRAKTTANLKAGNQELAGQIALRFQAVKKELEEN